MLPPLLTAVLLLGEMKASSRLRIDVDNSDDFRRTGGGPALAES